MRWIANSSLLLASFLWAFSINAQTNHLKKRVSLQFNQTTLNNVLLSLEEQGQFYFSYDAELIPSDSLISIKVVNEKLEKVLEQIAPPNIAYRSVGNHVVLFKESPKTPQEIVITGYVKDGRSQSPIANASLYSPAQNLLTASSATGAFQMVLPYEATKVNLVLSKSGYKTQVVYINPKQTTSFDFKLLTEEQSIANLKSKNLDSNVFFERSATKLFVPKQMLELSQNEEIYTKQAWQFSFLPGLSSNGFMNFSSVNTISLNLLSGFSRGTNGVEVGGLVNICKEYVNGLQLSGFGNVTGLYTKGVQLAGFSNYNGFRVDGLQFSGFSNVNGGLLNGVQLAGFANTLKGKMNGAQVSGFTNITSQNVDGLQLAGFANIAVLDVDFAQISGFANYAKNVKGLQLSSFYNMATHEAKGLQLSGFMNYAKSVSGAQISGFFNYTKINRGLQLSVINYADSSSGIPMGFMSYVKRGYHVLELSSNENFLVNISFKTGVKSFYNLFEVSSGSDNVRLSYGVGTLSQLSPKWQLNFDLVGGIVSSQDQLFTELNRYHYRFEPAVNFQINKNIGLAMGPTFNYYLSKLNAEGMATPLSTYSVFEDVGRDYFHQAWFGWKLGLRFF